MLTDSDSRRTGASSAHRVLDTLFTFTEEAPYRTAYEISEEAGIPIPSVHRYVALLRNLGLITDIQRGVYRLTPRIFMLSRAAHAANGTLEIADPHLRRLCTEINETVMLVHQVGDYPICAARHESTHMLRASFLPGHPLPPLRGASAKVLLSGMSPEELEGYLARMGRNGGELPSSEWLAEIDAIRARGWGTSSHEVNEGVWAASAAIHQRNQIVAAVSVASPDFRTTEQSRAEIIERLKEIARVISRELDLATR